MTKMEIEIALKIVRENLRDCDPCQGSGRAVESKDRRCSYCQGSGKSRPFAK